jgi:hypothetical protein
MAELSRSRIDHTNLTHNALKIIGAVVRSVFIVALMAVTWSISIPHSMSATALAHLSIGDVVRAFIGIVICSGMLAELAKPPREKGDYQTWVYIGLALASAWIVFIVLNLVFAAVAPAAAT